MYAKIIDGKLTDSINGTWLGNVANPTDGELADAGYFSVPEVTGEVESWSLVDGRLVPNYSPKDTRIGIVVSKAKIAEVVDGMGKTALFMAWLQRKAAYMTAWTDGSPTVIYDPSANTGDLYSLISALGIDAGQVAALIEQVKA